MLKSVLFTHCDLDGAGCRIIYEIYYRAMRKGMTFDVVNCGNGNDITEKVETFLEKHKDDMDKNTEIIFADICPFPETLQMLMNDFDDIKIFDHHKTALDIKDILPSAVIVPVNDEGKMECGTSLLYKHFLYDKRPDLTISHSTCCIFVETVRSYDTYEWKETNNMNAKKMQVLFTMLGMDRFCDNEFVNITNRLPLFRDHELEFIDAKIEYEQKMIDNVTPDNVISLTVRGYKAALFMHNGSTNISELGYQFLGKYPEFDIFVGFSMFKKGTFEFRTRRDDIDLGAEIAKPIGGGGHPKASGAPLTGTIYDDFVKVLENYLNGNS
jgi:oligoribonuclease NrnB/cAMP/cGMP phosphodiesterase (DHH superfamily)